MIRKFHANDHRVRNIMKKGTKWNWPKTSLRTSIADWEPKNSYIHLMQHTEHSQIENSFFKKQYPALFTIHQTKLFRNPDLEKKEFWMLRLIYAKNCGNYKLNSLTAKQVHTFYFDKFSSRLKWTETIFLITSRFKIYFFERIFITISYSHNLHSLSFVFWWFCDHHKYQSPKIDLWMTLYDDCTFTHSASIEKTNKIPALNIPPIMESSIILPRITWMIEKRIRLWKTFRKRS